MSLPEVSIRELAKSRTTYGMAYPRFEELVRRVLNKYNTRSLEIAERLARENNDKASLKIIKEEKENKAMK